MSGSLSCGIVKLLSTLHLSGRLAVYFLLWRVPLDKSEGSVKAIVILGGAQAPPALPCQRRLRTKTLESKISR